MASGVGLVAPAASIATITIGRNDNPDGVFAFSPNISSVVTLEEGSSVTLTVVRTAGAASNVVVDYVTSPTAGIVGGQGQLAFDAGVRALNITLQVPDDAIPEDAQEFVLALQEPNAGALGMRSIVTIRVPSNDDANGVLNMTGPALLTAAELAGIPNPVSVTVERLAGRLGSITVPWTVQLCSGTTPATCGERRDAAADINAAAGTLVFGPGAARRTISFDVRSDTVRERAELFAVSLDMPMGGARRQDPAQTVFVLVPANDDAVGFEMTSIRVSENDGAAHLTILRNGSALQRMTVSIEVSNAPGSRSDLAQPWSGPARQTVTFEADEQSRPFSVPLVADSTIQPQRAFVVALSRDDGSGNYVVDPAADQATVTVEANANAGGVFSLAYADGGAATNAAEASPPETRTVVITRRGANFGTVAAALTIGGACNGSDVTVTPSRATFDEGETRQTLTLTIVDDDTPELDEACEISLRLTDEAGILGTLNVNATADALTLTISSSDDPFGVVGFTTKTANGKKRGRGEGCGGAAALP